MKTLLNLTATICLFANPILAQASVTRYTCEPSGYKVDFNSNKNSQIMVWTNQNQATKYNTKNILLKTSPIGVDVVTYSTPDQGLIVTKRGTLVSLSEGLGQENCK